MAKGIRYYHFNKWEFEDERCSYTNECVLYFSNEHIVMLNKKNRNTGKWTYFRQSQEKDILEEAALIYTKKRKFLQKFLENKEYIPAEIKFFQYEPTTLQKLIGDIENRRQLEEKILIDKDQSSILEQRIKTVFNDFSKDKKGECR